MRKGFTLIETIIGVALLLIVFLAILGVIQLGTRMVAQSKARTTATALANQKIELARNLSYSQIGTVGGIPGGSISETETVNRNKISFVVKTTVFYIDDPFDGLFPDDSLAWDYKRIKVKVSWLKPEKGEVFLQTDVVPKGVETTGGGGIISVLVFDANGQPVPQADVYVENNDIVPPISANYQTDGQGRLFISGAPACNDCYKITISKSDWSTERTYAIGEQVRGIVLSIPQKPFLSVIENQLSEVSFSIDHLATKTIQTIKYFEEDLGDIIPIPNLVFTIQGAKILGLDSDNQPVYKYQETLVTGSNGQLIVSNLEWDSYRITVNGLATGYDIANSLPAQPININPGRSQTTVLKLANHQANTLLITVKDAGGQPLIGATIRLYRTGYDETKIGSDSGQGFFSPLSQGTYNLEIQLTGYQNWSGQIDISGQTEQTILMSLP